jgi:hypothetical protein
MVMVMVVRTGLMIVVVVRVTLIDVQYFRSLYFRELCVGVESIPSLCSRPPDGGL